MWKSFNIHCFILASKNISRYNLFSAETVSDNRLLLFLEHDDYFEMHVSIS